MKKIHKDLPIAEILTLVPDAVEVMLEEGLHCVGCGSNTMETLEQGMQLHGFKPENITLMVAKIQKLYEAQKEKQQQMHHPKPEDYMVKKHQEGNKTYYKVAGMLFSQKAYDAIHELSNEKPALGIRLDAGGCAGYSMKYAYQVSPKEDEQVFTLSNKMELHLNPFTFDKLHESIVDFESGLQGSGLKFINPNTKASCSCGISVAF